jgi:hypothetical protein
VPTACESGSKRETVPSVSLAAQTNPPPLAIALGALSSFTCDAIPSPSASIAPSTLASRAVRPLVPPEWTSAKATAASTATPASAPTAKRRLVMRDRFGVTT